MFSKRQLLILICVAATSIVIFESPAEPKSVATLALKTDEVRSVPVSFQGAIINLPAKPDKVVLGNQHSFSVDYVGNDVVIAPLSSRSRANVFIYVSGRRFSIDLYAKATGFTIIQIRDKETESVEVRYEPRN